MLGAVAVVDVPVHDQDPPEAQGDFGVKRPQGHIVEKAESHGPAPLGVVARRAGQGKGGVHFAGNHPVDGREQAAGRQQRRRVGPGRHNGVRRQGRLLPVRRGRDAVQVLGGVDRQDLLPLRRPGGDFDETV